MEERSQEDSLFQKELRDQLAVIEKKIDSLASDVGRRLGETESEAMRVTTASLREAFSSDRSGLRQPPRTAASWPPSAPALRAWAPDQSIGTGKSQVQPTSAGNRPASRGRTPPGSAVQAWVADSGAPSSSNAAVGSQRSAKLQAPERARPGSHRRAAEPPPELPRGPSAPEAWLIPSVPLDDEDAALQKDRRSASLESAPRAAGTAQDGNAHDSEVEQREAPPRPLSVVQRGKTKESLWGRFSRASRDSISRMGRVRTSLASDSPDSAVSSKKMKTKNFQTFVKAQMEVPTGRTGIKSVLTKFGVSKRADSMSLEVHALQSTWLWKFVHGTTFQVLTSSMICLNVILIGVTADAQLKSQLAGQQVSIAYEYIDRSFSVFFACEIILRMIAERWTFVGEPEWRWNLFDTILVLYSGVDFIIYLAVDNAAIGNLAASRVLRFARFIRVVRIARAVRAFHSLRIVVYAIFESCLSLVWCFIVVFLILYMFAVFFLFGVTEHIQYDNPQGDALNILKDFYGGVLPACVTLFMSISGGVDWSDAMQPLKHINWLYEPVFNFYVFFMVIGVMNVVVGAFVAATGDISNRDRELVVKNEIKELQEYTQKVATFFKEADKDRSGCLSWDEFKEYLKVPKVSAYFQALQLDVAQAHIIFKLLDGDESHEVNLDEFLQGCMRLRGPAKGIDLNMMMYEQKKMQDKLGSFMHWVHQKLEPAELVVDPVEHSVRNSSREDEAVASSSFH